ncbi:MAG TPA: acyl-CoA dehydrogenase family protein [Myxococcota bacterium]|nr:acyl-CoA dehydrogenase family protein [Myxococcota bacterium]
MDLEASGEQQAIVEAVRALLARHAGPARAIELAAKGAYDSALEAALGAAGFLDVARAEGTGPLEAALVVEEVARAGGTAAVGAAALVGPCALGERALPGPIALASGAAGTPVRFAAHARTLVVDAGEVARVVTLAPGEAEVVVSSYGYPLGRLPSLEGRGESAGAGSGEALRRWWRVALAAELAGTLRAALDVTLAHVKQRRQFGRAIGSFQAVQHRLAECHVLVEGSAWLTREAAWRGADAESAAAAAAFAGAAAARVFTETHQLSGAIGYTREHDLHVFSMRLQALRLELGGVGAHRRALASARWVGGP